MRTDNRRPLEKNLIAVFSFVRVAKIIVQVTVLKAQAIKFAEIPGEERCVTHGPLSGVATIGA